MREAQITRSKKSRLERLNEFYRTHKTAMLIMLSTELMFMLLCFLNVESLRVPIDAVFVISTGVMCVYFYIIAIASIKDDAKTTVVLFTGFVVMLNTNVVIGILTFF